MKKVGVFCGTQLGSNPGYAAVAARLGSMLAANSIAVVYGASSVGMMGALADAALADGGDVIGVIPTSLFEAEHLHTGLTEVREVDTMHERKATMFDISDGFIVLPGGSGTLDEFFDIWTWQKVGLHKKPIALLNTYDYWNPLLTMLDHMVTEGFMKPHARSLIVEEDLDLLIKRFLRTPT